MSINPTSNPIIARDSAWQQTYDKDTAAVSPQEKKDADTLTGQIYDALHGQNGQSLDSAQAAVNLFSAKYSNDPTTRDLQTLLDVAKYETTVSRGSVGEPKPFSDPNALAAAQTSLKSIGADSDADNLEDYVRNTVVPQYPTIGDSIPGSANGPG